MNTNNIAVIFVHFHTPALLKDAVESVQVELAGLDYEIIVVDNGSTDAERGMLRRLPVRYLPPDQNSGYAAGINRGVAQTDAKTLFLLNSDILVLPGSFRHLLAALDDGFDIVSPQQYWNRSTTFLLPVPEQRSRIDFVLERLATRSKRWAAMARRRWRRNQHRHWLAKGPQATPQLSGACLALKRACWQPFDEGYPLYFEETDWLLNAQKRGLRVGLVPHAQLIHFYNQSSSKLAEAGEHFGHSYQRFVTRHYGRTFVKIIDKLLPSTVHPLQRWQTVTALSASALTARELAPPYWIEIALNPRGFPAAAQFIDKGTHWTMPDDLWSSMTPGDYYLSVVTGQGKWLPQFRFVKPN